ITGESNAGATGTAAHRRRRVSDAAAEARCERGGASQERAASAGASRHRWNWLVARVKEVSMAVTVKRITLWRADVENRPGVLAAALEPLAAAGADLRLVMGYRFPNAPEHSAIELYPVSGKKVVAAARQAGLGGAKPLPRLL